MTQPTLNPEALEKAAWRDLEIAADAEGALEASRVTLPIEKVRALVAGRRAALPPIDAEPVAGDLVERLRRVKVFDDHPSNVPLGEEAAAAIIALQGERNEADQKAERQWAGWIKADCARKAAEAEVARLKDELAEAHRVIGDLMATHVPLGLAGEEAAIRARSFRDGQKTGEATAICKSCGQSFPLSAPHDCPGLTAGSQKGASDE